MRIDKLTSKLQTALADAQSIAVGKDHNFIEPVHLMQALLDQLVEVAKDDSQNIMPVTIELVKKGATMGDIVERLKGIWGIYRETPVF